MRINCEVTLVNRQLSGSSTGQRAARPVRSSLAIAAAAGEPCVHLCTAVNKKGTTYKIKNNVVKVFMKFLSEGKFSISLKKPPMDLIVKSDPLQAKNFLTTLRSCVTGVGVEKVQLAPLAPIKASSLLKPRKTMVITSKADYPITTGFPYSLEELTVTNCGLSRIERRMLNLKRLKHLHLDNNRIHELPGELTAVTCLTVLHLPANKLSKIHPDIFNGQIANTLADVNLANNQMTLLPRSFCLLLKLVTANLSNNRLQQLPFTMNKLKELRYLDVGSNSLHSLPLALCHLSIESIDISNNPLKGDYQYDGPPPPRVLTLLETAGRVAVRTSPRRDFSTLPLSLQTMLRYSFQCHCGKPALTQVMVKTYSCAPPGTPHIAREVRSNSGDHDGISMRTICCSASCS